MDVIENREEREQNTPRMMKQTQAMIRSVSHNFMEMFQENMQCSYAPVTLNLKEYSQLYTTICAIWASISLFEESLGAEYKSISRNFPVCTSGHDKFPLPITVVATIACALRDVYPRYRNDNYITQKIGGSIDILMEAGGLTLTSAEKNIQ
ncbi:hypothetical protein COW46_02875 [Candidatus Gracilibacteria bacterium CG17_big_fil_post_rev_8_21_14_2_50_48_13]|nr:MAG: hypothetical protein COW46_02875 [Candidatus Gracilibacteria bacterium CG17_big_fil_post_rev_8_21_14_2_50_48_13]